MCTCKRAKMKAGGFMTDTAASHQGANKMFWHQNTWGAVMLSVLI